MRLLLVLFLFACNAPTEPAGSDLGQYEFDPPGDVRPADDWGEMMAEQYADSLEEARIQDSTENAEFARWADSMAIAER